MRWGRLPSPLSPFAALPSAQSPSIAVQTEQQHGQKVRHALLVPDFRVGEREHQQQPHDQVLDRRALEEQKLAERSRAVLPDCLLAFLVLWIARIAVPSRRNSNLAFLHTKDWSEPSRIVNTQLFVTCTQQPNLVTPLLQRLYIARTTQTYDGR